MTVSVQADHRIALAQGYANVLRRRIAHLERLLEVRAALFLFGAEAEGLWR